MSASLDVVELTDGVPARSAVRVEDLATSAGFRDFGDLPDRDLSQDELLALASSVSVRRDSWEHEVEFAAGTGHRHYACLHRDAHVDVWLLCWTPGDDTGWHDHDVSSGAVAVVQGCLTERNLAVGAASFDTEVGAGHVFSFGPDHIHRLTGRDDTSVSVHAYSPPLWRMGQYAVSANGVLSRVSVSYADELRPLGPEPIAIAGTSAETGS